jgi:type IV pilus assembly protein PilX
MANHSLRHKSPKEGGAVLIIGMIFVLVLIMIVASVMRSATLEERMAANARDRQLALQAAEAVSRDAAAALFTAATPVSPIDPFDLSGFTATCTNGFCNAGTPQWKSVTWTDETKTRTFAADASKLSVVSIQPRYIVEPVQSKGGQPGKICPSWLFRITARGLGKDASIVFVESMYWYTPHKYVDGYCG